MTGRRRTWVGLATFAILLALWFGLTTWSGTVSAGRFPSPTDFWLALVQIVTRGYAGGELFTHALHSVALVGMGFCVAIATGALKQRYLCFH